MHTINTLKTSQYTFYGINSIASCFSPDMRSIISFSDSCYLQIYDIETGETQRLRFFKNTRAKAKKHAIYQISFSPNSQQILITIIYGEPGNSFKCLYIIKTDNEDRFLTDFVYTHKFVLSDDSEYLAAFSEKKLYIYKITPFKQCIGEFDFQVYPYPGFTIAISANFHDIPKVAFESSGKIFLCNFIFKNKSLELLSQQELTIGKNIVNQLMFTDNNKKLIVACIEKFIIWDAQDNHHEEYTIQANRANISRDGTLLIYCNLDESSQDIPKHKLCLWSITQKRLLIVQTTSLAIINVQISPDNRYIIGTVENGGTYVWKIIGNTFRLLWRTSHNLQTQGLILGDNNLESGIEEDLVKKMGAMKITNI